MRKEKRTSIKEFVNDPKENYNHMSEDFLHGFWDEKVELEALYKSGIPARNIPVRVNHAHYCVIVDENGNVVQADGGFAGFGGARFDIEFLDGRRLATTNLWYQGVIPTDYDETLPDNAKFLTPRTLEKLGWN